MWIKSLIIVWIQTFVFFLFFQKDSIEESKTDTQNKQSIDSLDLLLIIYKDFTEIGVGDPYRTQNRKEGDL